MQKCLNILLALYFQDNVKRKVKYLAETDNNERKRQKMASELMSSLTLVTEWFKNDTYTGRTVFRVQLYNRELYRLMKTWD